MDFERKLGTCLCNHTGASSKTARIKATATQIKVLAAVENE
jgi:hypothetical protein